MHTSMSQAPSWSNQNSFDDTETFEQLCQESKASDYYFHVAQNRNYQNRNYAMISIVPKLFFDTFGYMMDRTPMLDHLLPDGYGGELTDSVFESKDSQEVTRQEMLSRGFLQNDAFSALINGIDKRVAPSPTYEDEYGIKVDKNLKSSQ
jgi:hypothetical protein